MMKGKGKNVLTRYRKTVIGVWGSSAVIFAAVLVLFYLPQHETMAQAQHRYQDSNRLAAVAQQAASEEARRQIEERAAEMRDQLDAFTIGSDQVSRLVFEIGRMADSLDLQGYSSKYLEAPTRAETPTESTLLSEAWLSVEFTGSYEQFARFVNLLERNRPAIFVEKMSVLRGHSENENCRFQMELSLVTTVDTTAAVTAKTD